MVLLPTNNIHYTPPLWVKRIAVIPAVYESDDANYFIKMLKQQLGTSAHGMIIMPESALHCSNNVTFDELAKWCVQYKMPSLMIGFLQHHETERLNGVCIIQDGVVTLHYKAQAVPFVERIPGAFSWIGSYAHYFADQEMQLYHGKKQSFTFMDGVKAHLYICSEFFSYNTPHSYNQDLVIALCNDRWSRFDYLKKIMFYGSFLKAIIWKQSILYMAYEYAALLDYRGQVFFIDRV